MLLVPVDLELFPSPGLEGKYYFLDWILDSGLVRILDWTLSFSCCIIGWSEVVRAAPKESGTWC